ncbi:Putative Acid ceramidase [Septoria linicola]|uniref:ceramidase n=1 Tax=Septoria linicola TaxID=215465 RepID=A0A9Q9EJ06_9PEZI|nr:putative Acid ceramidase [Septoria linicola]USW51674.1 Putative Acid ceramidase [Septoria linicola]
MPATRSQTLRETAASIGLPQHNVADPHQLNVNIRQRSTASDRKGASTESLAMLRTRYPDTPPRFTIDLSLPPEQRYLHVCAAFQEEVAGLTSLFDEVVAGMLYQVPLKWVHFVCRILLRSVYDREENKELKGISKATGVSMYLLICFNVLLDLFMGCSSGGAAVSDGNGTKTLHFRTLDWGMPSLRKVVVQLDFQIEKNGPIVASSLTYVGYVGVLTGVRKSMSLSLNFRPHRNEKGQFWADTSYTWHLSMVLLGQRRSISSELRRFLLPKPNKRTFPQSDARKRWTAMSYDEIVGAVMGKTAVKTTACYLCFSNGKETTVIEKDYRTAICRTSEDFVVITNTDQDRPDSTGTVDSTDSDDSRGTDNSESSTNTMKQKAPTGMEDLLEEAKDRQQCAEHNYRSLRANGMATEEDVIALVQKYPTTNEETHFACVMDPKEGTVKWCRRWVKPVSARWIREHMSETW